MGEEKREKKGNLDLLFLSISAFSGPQKSRQNGLSDNILFFDTAPVSQYVVNEGAGNKLNSMDSLLVDLWT